MDNVEVIKGKTGITLEKATKEAKRLAKKWKCPIWVCGHLTVVRTGLKIGPERGR